MEARHAPRHAGGGRLSFLLPAPGQCCLCPLPRVFPVEPRGTALRFGTWPSQRPELGAHCHCCCCHVTVLLVDLDEVDQEEICQGQGFCGCQPVDCDADPWVVSRSFLKVTDGLLLSLLFLSVVPASCLGGWVVQRERPRQVGPVGRKLQCPGVCPSEA